MKSERFIIADNPKRLFLIDGCGAMLSAFLLGVVLVKLEGIFGIPPSTLYILASLPIIFAIYDFYCYRTDNVKLGVSLKIIAIMNLLYCCLSIGFVLYYYKEIKIYGLIYIFLEVIIIITLAILELRVANELIKNSSKNE